MESPCRQTPLLEPRQESNSDCLLIEQQKTFCNEQPPTINDEKALPIKMLEIACLTHTVLQEAADVHGSCNAGATASEVPGILLEVGLRQFLEDLRCAARIDSLIHMMSNFIYCIYIYIYTWRCIHFLDSPACNSLTVSCVLWVLEDTEWWVKTWHPECTIYQDMQWWKICSSKGRFFDTAWRVPCHFHRIKVQVFILWTWFVW